jgi:hypothetical protein
MLVDDATMIDHGWAVCPDSSIVHIGMGTRESEQHTAVLRRFSADMTLLSESTLIDNDTRTTIVDAIGATVCTVLLHQGVFKASYADYPADRL